MSAPEQPGHPPGPTPGPSPGPSSDGSPAASDGSATPPSDGVPERAGTTRAHRRPVLLRLDPAVHDALATWASSELRSTNAQIEFLLRRALSEAGRLPAGLPRVRRPGRPPSGGS